MKLYYSEIDEAVKPPARLMLQACTAGSAAKQQALTEQWEEAVDINEIDYSAMRLVPLFYYKNQQAGITTKHDKRLKVIYKYWWLKTQHITNQLNCVYSQLVGAGMKPVVIKGAALMGYYPKPELRTMADFDLVIAPVEIDDALVILKRAGYVPHTATEQMLLQHRELALCFSHSIECVHAATETRFDLHWKIGSDCSEQLTQRMLSTLTPFTGLPGAQKPAPEYEVFLIIVHAISAWQRDNLNWMVDVDMLNRLYNKSFWQKAREIAVQEKRDDMFDYGCFLLQQNGIYAPPVKSNRAVRIPYVIANSKSSKSSLYWYAYRLSDNLLIAHYFFPHYNWIAKFIQACRRMRYRYFYTKAEKNSAMPAS